MAIACSKGNVVLALTERTMKTPVVVDISSNATFVGPVPTLVTYPVLPGETFNLFTYVMRNHPDGGLRRYHGPKTKLANLWLKDSGTFTTSRKRERSSQHPWTIAYVQHVPENNRKSIQIVARPADDQMINWKRQRAG
ncbi:hypothetical protein QR680_006825 [Steinernema hermaphroditum]|nr:hypothetical protein QR680_006825 [Steinernema hermaphroditum]